jgi:hypothetical protein
MSGAKTDEPRDDYDEENESTRYVLGHHRSLMTILEVRIVRTIHVEQKADAAASEFLASRLRSRWGHRGEEEVARALEAGPTACLRNIRDRLLRDHADQIEINRCPNCHRVVRTPRARQCFWCGHDWH